MNLIDKDEFCKQVKLCENAMYALAYSILKNDNDACDVIGEAIIKAYQNINLLKDKAAFKSWILKIVHNSAVEFIRKNANIVSLDEFEFIEESHESSILTSYSLKEAIERLNQPYRTVIVLFYYEDFSIAEISNITGASVINVKKRLSRARKQLQEILKEDFSNGQI